MVIETHSSQPTSPMKRFSAMKDDGAASDVTHSLESPKKRQRTPANLTNQSGLPTFLKNKHLLGSPKNNRASVSLCLDDKENKAKKSFAR